MPHTPDLLTPPTVRKPMNPVLKLILSVVLILVGGYLLLAFAMYLILGFGLDEDHKCTPETQRYMESKLETTFPATLHWEKFYYVAARDASMEGVFTIPASDLYAMFPEDRFAWQSVSPAEADEMLKSHLKHLENPIPEGFDPTATFRIIPDAPGVAQYLRVIAEFPKDEAAPVRVWMSWFTT